MSKGARRGRVAAWAAFAAAGVVSWSVASATEGGRFAGPIGGSDIRSALLPPAGWYGGGFVFAFDGDGYRDAGGNRTLTPDIREFKGTSTGVALLRVWPAELWGGRIATSLSLPRSESCLQVGERRECARGFSDVYSDLLIWSRRFGHLDGTPPDAKQPDRGLSTAAALSAIFPTGKYKVERLISTSSNTYVFIPSVAATYLTEPRWLDGTEFSAKLYYDVFSRNGKTRYRAGRTWVLDAAVSERYGTWQFGVAMAFAKQVSDDDRDGVQIQPNGNRMVGARVGGVVSKTFPSLKSSVTVKVMHEVHSINRIASDTFVVRYGMAF